MATIVISSPSTVTRTPVSTGRASSREAARATRLIVSRSGARRQLDRVALGLGKSREVIGRKGAQVKARGAGADLDVALGLAEAERDGPVGKRARHLDQ